MVDEIVEKLANENYSKTNPFPGRLLNNQKLSKEGSGKETYHIEISIAGSGIKYKCGDALAVLPHNDRFFVKEFLQMGGYSGNESVRLAGEKETTLESLLTTKFNLQTISPELLKELKNACTDDYEGKLLDKFLDPGYKKEFKANYFDVIDVLKALPHTKIEAQNMVNSLKPIRQRLYSIASSPTKYPDEIHLCIVVNNTEINGRLRRGVASNYICRGVDVQGLLDIYLQPNKHFTLPDKKDVPIIMVGPGTGIAPFRAFLQEREEVGDKGKNWLFFGEQKEAYDFLYKDEFTAMVDSGFLNRLDTAFSRDQDFKIYVQDKMRENAHELWQWLEAGAYFYVCGDAKRMAVDVDNALHDAIISEGGKNEAEAKAYVKALKKEKRYVRDIY